MTDNTLTDTLRGLRADTTSSRPAEVFPEVGAIYDVVLDTDTFVQWLVLYPPRDDGWVLVAPVDLVPLLGRSDYFAPTEFGETVTVRAGRSAWLWPALVTGDQPVDRIEDLDLDCIRSLARGGFGPGSEDTAQELVVWCKELDEVENALQRRLAQRGPEVVPIVPTSVLEAWWAGDRLSPEDAARVLRYVNSRPINWLRNLKWAQRLEPQERAAAEALNIRVLVDGEEQPATSLRNAMGASELPVHELASGEMRIELGGLPTSRDLPGANVRLTVGEGELAVLIAQGTVNDEDLATLVPVVALALAVSQADGHLELARLYPGAPLFTVHVQTLPR